MFVVIKVGVYRHTIGGVYSSLELAKEGAEKCLRSEGDDYHEYEIVKTTLNHVDVEDGEAGTQYGGPIEENVSRASKIVTGQRFTPDFDATQYKNCEIRWQDPNEGFRYAKRINQELDEFQRLAIDILNRDPIALDIARAILEIK